MKPASEPSFLGPFSKRQLIRLGALLALALAGITVSGLLWGWDLGEWLGAFGLLVSIGGFTIALVEIRQARAVSEATSAAVKTTLKAVAAGRLAVSITQLRQLVIDLEEANDHDDRQGARRVLNGWRYVGGDAEGLLVRRFGVDHDALGPLRRSIRLASEAKSSLHELDTTREATSECLEAMDKTADALGPLLERINPTTEETDG